VQDNPGAGATSDNMEIVRRLVERGVRGAVAGAIFDPETAARAHRSGTDVVLRCSVGGRSGTPGTAPLEGAVRVVALADGHFECTGKMYRGAHATVGPTALLRIEDEHADVQIVVTSQRFQCLDQALFRHVGIEPAKQRLLVVKSTVHFRADFDPIAAQTLLVEAPGTHPCRLENLAYRNLRDGVRRGPNGPMSGA